MSLVSLVGAAENIVVTTTNTPYLPSGEEGEFTHHPIPRFVRSGREAGVAFVTIQGPANVMSITLASYTTRPQAKALDDSTSSAPDGITNTLEMLRIASFLPSQGETKH
jgi:hypothetical protein